MENGERIAVSYEGNTVQTMDWAQGISVHKRALKKVRKKAVKPLSAVIQSQFVAGGVFTVFSAAYLYVTRHNPSAIRTAIAAFDIGLAVMYWSLGFILQKGMNQIRKAYTMEHAGGEMIFDSFGIEDREQSGKTVKISWSEYELCVITDQVITLLLGNMLYAVPYTDEACGRIVQALDVFGKSGTVVDCKNA